jgi:hypothetical protein
VRGVGEKKRCRAVVMVVEAGQRLLLLRRRVGVRWVGKERTAGRRFHNREVWKRADAGSERESSAEADGEGGCNGIRWCGRSRRGRGGEGSRTGKAGKGKSSQVKSGQVEAGAGSGSDIPSSVQWRRR